MEIQMINEEEVWKCPKHPSKRNRSGICAKCLRDRLGDLCPNCANVRPCNTCPVTVTASFSASSFLLRFSSTRESAGAEISTEVSGTEIAADRASPTIQRSRSVAVSFLRSKLAEGETIPPIAADRVSPSIQRSRSVAVSFLRSRFVEREGKPPVSGGRRKSVVWSILKTMRSKRVDRVGDNGVDENAKKTSEGVRSYFPSPIRAFRHHSVVVQDREVPPCRG